jgi:hypothetical protein
MLGSDLDFYYNVIQKKPILTRAERVHYKEIRRKADAVRRMHGIE